MTYVRAGSIPLRTGLYTDFDQISEPVEAIDLTKRSHNLLPRVECKAI